MESPGHFMRLSEILRSRKLGLGDKPAALAFPKRAVAANPIEKDAVMRSGVSNWEILERAAARMGEPDRAIAALQKKPLSHPLRWSV